MKRSAIPVFLGSEQKTNRRNLMSLLVKTINLELTFLGRQIKLANEITHKHRFVVASMLNYNIKLLVI